MAIPRNLKPDGINELFTGDTIRLVVNEDQGGDRMPNAGSIFSYVFDNSPVAPVSYTELTKEEPEHIRAIAYNVLRDNAWSNAGLPSLERIATTLEGDIFCFQESGGTSEQVAKNLLDTWLPLDNGGAGWYVYKDAGRLTCSKWPITNTWDLWRKTAILVDLPSSYPKDLLVINGHLSCCTANADRQGQVDEFASFLLDAKSPGGAITLPDSTPVIFLGDMNFVGFRQQVSTVITGNIRNAGTYGPGAPLDWDNTDLADARPLHIDSNLVFTWRDLGGDGFPPGRLDYQFYTDAVFDNAKSFVLQTETMDPQELARYDLQQGDTEVSDHLPLVVDYAFKQPLVSTSLKDQTDKVEVRIYPNPARNTLFIETQEKIERITLRDLAGREVLAVIGHTQQLGLDSLLPGTYLVEVKLEKQAISVTHKITLVK
ncbi:MAG: T9SS type A sorting domain-containing protein [Bacteroidota bacterium]